MENKKYILKKLFLIAPIFSPAHLQLLQTLSLSQFMCHMHTQQSSLYSVARFSFPYLPVFAPARPQPTSRPLVPQKHVQARQVLLSWEPGSDGLSPVRYYTVQLRELPESNWTVHSASVSHEATTYIVSR